MAADVNKYTERVRFRGGPRPIDSSVPPCGPGRRTGVRGGRVCRRETGVCEGERRREKRVDEIGRASCRERV